MLNQKENKKKRDSAVRGVIVLCACVRGCCVFKALPAGNLAKGIFESDCFRRTVTRASKEAISLSPIIISGTRSNFPPPPRKKRNLTDSTLARPQQALQQRHAAS